VSEDSTFAEVIAVLGTSCRFAPDLDSLDTFWEFLGGGRSAVTEMPDKRWDPYAASSPQATAVLCRTTRKGSFLTDIEGFDADFFGMLELPPTMLWNKPMVAALAGHIVDSFRPAEPEPEPDGLLAAS